MKNAIALAIVLCLPFAATAQSAANYDGTWRATYKTERGIDRDGTVIVQGTGGSWDLAVQARNDPCVGRKWPIVVEQSTPEELVFKVTRAVVLAGCQDNTMRMKPVDANTLEGMFMGRPFTLTRQN